MFKINSEFSFELIVDEISNNNLKTKSENSLTVSLNLVIRLRVFPKRSDDSL